MPAIFIPYKVNDKAYNKLGFSIHNYFFAKAINQVRPGGVVAFVTSRYTMDSKDSTARKHMAERADLLGAIRLPNNAFKANAGTEVVSDIIFLQKRDRPADIEPDWVQLGKTEDGFAINQYFVDHPEMVLGELTTESTQYGREELTVAPIEGTSLADQLAEAVQHIEGQYTAAEVDAPDIAEEETTRRTLPADPDVKNFSYTVVDGEVFYRENSVMTQVELSDTAKGRVTGMVELRQIVNELIDQQLNDYPDEDIQATQAKLNTTYDAFTAKYGLLNDRKNGRLFEQDPSYYLLCSLENLDEQGQLKSKAAMFTKRTIRPERTVTSVDTPSEALAVSIGEHGKVDLPYMAEMLGTPGEYTKDTSNKIKAVFDARMKDGKRCSGSIPYGYNRLPNDKQTLVVDPVASEVVKRIFLLANEGKSPRAIAELLTEEKVLIPAAYAQKYHPEQYNGIKFSDPYLWGTSSVRTILGRQEYLGHTVLRKSVSTNFKLHKRKKQMKMNSTFSRTRMNRLYRKNFGIVFTQMPSESCFCLGNAHQLFKRVSGLCRLRQKIDLANTLMQHDYLKKHAPRQQQRSGLHYGQRLLSAESDRSSPDRAAPHRAVGPLT